MTFVLNNTTYTQIATFIVIYTRREASRAGVWIFLIGTRNYIVPVVGVLAKVTAINYLQYSPPPRRYGGIYTRKTSAQTHDFKTRSIIIRQV